MKSKLPTMLKEDLGYNYFAKEAFHREARKVLKELAKALCLAKGTFELRSNKGGIAVSGEVTLHTDTLYVQVSQSCLGPSRDDSSVLYRSCKGRRDYTGGRNHFASAEALCDSENFVQCLERAGLRQATNAAAA
jgi:hypothetical protein